MNVWRGEAGKADWRAGQCIEASSPGNSYKQSKGKSRLEKEEFVSFLKNKELNERSNLVSDYEKPWLESL